MTREPRERIEEEMALVLARIAACAREVRAGEAAAREREELRRRLRRLLEEYGRGAGDPSAPGARPAAGEAPAAAGSGTRRWAFGAGGARGAEERGC